MAKLSGCANLGICILAVVILFLDFSVNAVDVEVKGPYEFLELVMHSPSAYCNTGKFDCTRVPKNFTIASFRPMYYWHTAVPPFNLSGCEIIKRPPKTLPKNELAGILTDMEEYWLSLHPQIGNDVFWDSDWFWYGRCFNTPTAPRLYFEAGLRLAKSIDIKRILFVGGIPPDGQRYSYMRIKSIIQRSLGVEVRLNCNHNADGVVQLLEVSICFSRYQKIIGCWPRHEVDNDKDDICSEAENGMVLYAILR